MHNKYKPLTELVFVAKPAPITNRIFLANLQEHHAGGLYSIRFESKESHQILTCSFPLIPHQLPTAQASTTLSQSVTSLAIARQKVKLMDIHKPGKGLFSSS